MFSNIVDIISNIPLSNNSVSRRIDKIADKITGTQVAELKSTKFALQVDEFTLRGSSNKNCLQITIKGDLRLFLSDIQPDFSSLASRHLIQGSH